VPEYGEKINASPIGAFIHLCLIRALREDRTNLASSIFIEKVLSRKYVEPINDKIDELYEESAPDRPVLYLLQAGADPTQTVDDFAARKKKPAVNKVSMGEAQEIPAKEKLLLGHKTGQWLLLSNCQLSLELMAEMENLLRPTDHDVDPNFRLWITCEATPEFPLGLLQMGIKNSFVPPKGL
jgi:dynein heavy chain, axonemal